MRSLFKAAVLVTILTAANASADDSEVAALATAWTGTNEASVIAALYADDAVLWGTTRSEVIVGHEGILQYFEEANASFPGLKAEIQDGMVTQVFDETAINSGIYKITNIVEGAEKWSIFGRFTFVYRSIDGQWKIVAHHSSRMPN